MRDQQTHEVDVALLDDTLALVPAERKPRHSGGCADKVDLNHVDIALRAGPFLKVWRSRVGRRRGQTGCDEWLVHGQAAVEMPLGEAGDLRKVFSLELQPVASR